MPESAHATGHWSACGLVHRISTQFRIRTPWPRHDCGFKHRIGVESRTRTNSASPVRIWAPRGRSAETQPRSFGHFDGQA